MKNEKIQIETAGQQNIFSVLENAEVYPHKPESVKHVQTHISHVYIVPPFVYKFKKPVDFGFVDYKTLDKRKHFCEREVELNGRLCPDIYLGVVSVADEAGELIEYAVKMKKLDDRYFLDSYIENDTLTAGHLDRVTNLLYGFYSNQTPDKEVLKYGEIEHIQYNTDENFEQTEDFIDETIPQESYHAIKHFTDRYFESRESLFLRRINEKRIVDGHGDLHLEHIHVTPEKVCIYDCIEFNDRFRYGDLAADLAFLVMDLDFRNRWKESRYFIEKMSQKLDDADLLEIIDFYKCYRAYVKGKVKSFQSEEEEVSEKDRKESRNKAGRYFNLSLRYAILGSKPLLLIFMGRIATGKSTLAEHVKDTMSIKGFSSDRIRKKLAGIPLHKRVSELKREELYSAEMSEKTYSKLLEKAGNELQKGRSVILDATFSNRSGREELVKTLEKKGINYLFIEAQASDETVISRLKERENSEKESVSDARLEDYEKLNERYKPPDEIPAHSIIRINTDNDFQKTVEMLYKKFIDKHIDDAT